MDASTVVEILWVSTYFTVLLGLSAYGIHRYSIIYLFLKNSRKRPVPKAKFEELPRVTVQLPIFNEMYVVRRLLQAVAKIDYPRDRLQVQVLDDSTDETVEISREEVAKLKAQGIDVELIQRTNRVGFKAGALQEGMKTATGEFFFILDADFVPQPEILHEFVHFFTDKKIGMIQARWGHINRKYSLLTRIQAMFLDGHLLLEQTARSRSGRFFNFNGTAGMWRRKCIEDAGGWQHDTLTEDLDLSYRGQLKGWKFIFLSDLVIPAELPVDMNGFKSQQHRWTKGSIQTCKKMLKRIWGSNYPLIVKIEGTIHLTSNFAYLLLLALCFLIHPSIGATELKSRLVLLDIPIFLAASVSVTAFYICAQISLHPKTWWRDIVLLPMVLALGIGMSINNTKAVLEAVFNQESDFTRTPKYGIERKKTAWRKSRYSPMKSLIPLIETGFALYFTYITVLLIERGLWISVPFMLLFQVGFSYVAFCSIRQWLPASLFSGTDTMKPAPSA